MKKDIHNWDGLRRLLKDLFPGLEPVDDLQYSGAGLDVRKLLAYLPFRQVFIIIERYGLHGGNEHTYEEIGQFLGRSAENVRSHETKALRMLQASRGSLSGYMDWSEA